MKKISFFIITIVLFTTQSCSEKDKAEVTQSKPSPAEEVERLLNKNRIESPKNIYTQAITEYLKAVNKTEKLVVDTLFVGPDKYLHGVELPPEIQGIKIAGLTHEEGDRKIKYSKPFVYVSIIATISKETAEILFVTFVVEKSVGKANWWPKHNSYFNFMYDTTKKEFVYEKQRFEYTYSNKYTKKK